MKWNRKGHGAFSAVTAGALVLGLSACDQIQSLWKSEDKTNPATGAVAQPKPAEGTIQVAKAIEIPKSIEAPKPPVDENKVLANKIKSALAADPALKILAIDAAVSDGAVTLYATSPRLQAGRRTEQRSGEVLPWDPYRVICRGLAGRGFTYSVCCGPRRPTLRR